MTLRQAISDLADAGYVSRLQGSGTFASGSTISKNGDLTGFSEDMAARGFSSSSRLVTVTRVPAGPIRGPELVLSPADPIYHIERVRMADGIPMCLENVDLPADLVPGLELQDLTGSLYDILKSEYGLELVEANQVITATVVDQTEADLLRVPVHSPALIVKRLGFDRHRRPVERAISVYRGDRYDVQLTVKRRTL
jgi:GntR family transcriptional regulator